MGIEEKVDEDEKKSNLGKTIAIVGLAFSTAVVLAYLTTNYLYKLCQEIVNYGAQFPYSK